MMELPVTLCWGLVFWWNNQGDESHDVTCCEGLGTSVTPIASAFQGLMKKHGLAPFPTLRSLRFDLPLTTPRSV